MVKKKKRSKDRLSCIERELRREEKELQEIDNAVLLMREKMIEKHPSKFSGRNVINAFFGALIIGLTFTFKGNLIGVVHSVRLIHIVLIILSTLIILTAEIYFISYTRVKNKKERPFYKFWAKRTITLYIVTLLVSIYLVHIFGLNSFFDNFFETLKMVIVISMPCSIGAAIPSLLKQY